MTALASLRAIKLFHTIVWALFAGCIVALPVVAWTGHLRVAAVLIGVVMFEVLVLLVNGLRCPLTGVAARFTSDRRANFDIYLPEWLARFNKAIFGSVFAGGVVFTVALWLLRG